MIRNKKSLFKKNVLLCIVAFGACCSFISCSLFSSDCKEHDWNLTSKIDSTFVKEGEEYYTCKKCYETKKEKVAMKDPVHVFTETVESANTTGTYGTGSYVYFGDWPQTKASYDISFRSEPESNGYYVGSDGYYYGEWSGTKYKVEPILWIVCDNNYNGTGKKLLLAENILTKMPFCDADSISRTAGGESGINQNNYKYSEIRSYLNGLDFYKGSSIVSDYKDNGFLQTAFSKNAQSKISLTTVDNSASSTTYSNSSTTNNYACANTSDYIFLLSEYEVTKYSKSGEVYNVGGSGNSRIRKPTDYARARGVAGNWWLRSPVSIAGSTAYYVSDNGNAAKTEYVSTFDGVVPALVLK